MSRSNFGKIWENLDFFEISAWHFLTFFFKKYFFEKFSQFSKIFFLWPDFDNSFFVMQLRVSTFDSRTVYCDPVRGSSRSLVCLGEFPQPRTVSVGHLRRIWGVGRVAGRVKFRCFLRIFVKRLVRRVWKICYFWLRRPFPGTGRRFEGWCHDIVHGVEWSDVMQVDFGEW